LHHVAACPGSNSEEAVRTHFGLPIEAMLDMGDFAGGVIKYIFIHPVPRLTIAGGFGKMVKLAQGAMDLHSGRSQVDFEWLATLASQHQLEIRSANTAQHALEICGPTLATRVAKVALEKVNAMLVGSQVVVDIVIVDRTGKIVAHAT
jgi:cobalt-precorrin-5B (C1)-methyltransferase